MFYGFDVKKAKQEKANFEEEANKIITTTKDMVRDYNDRYNERNKIRKDINNLLAEISLVLRRSNIKISKSIYEISFNELSKIINNNISSINHKDLEYIKQKLDAIKSNAKQITSITDELDNFKISGNNMESDYDDELTIDLNDYRLSEKNDYFTLSPNGEYFNFVVNKISLKEAVRQIYGDVSYLGTIYKYSSNKDIIDNKAYEFDTDADDVMSNVKYLQGTSLRLPVQIEIYEDTKQLT